MKRVITIAAAALLAGCVTDNDFRESCEFREINKNVCVSNCVKDMIGSYSTTETKFLGDAAASSMATAESGIFENAKAFCQQTYAGGCYDGGYYSVREIHPDRTAGRVGLLDLDPRCRELSQ